METAGQDRLVAYHTLAHGGDGINFFRWRNCRFGAEQARGGYEYHGIFSERFHEGKRIAAELHGIAKHFSQTTYQAQIGLFYSFDMGWAYDIRYVYPRSRWLDATGYWRLVEEYYAAFWNKNIPMEALGPADDFSAFNVVLVPCLYLTTDDLNEKLCEYVAHGGTLIVGPASGTKDWNNVYIDTLPPDGKLKALFGCELTGSGEISFANQDLSVTLTADAPLAAGQTFACQTKSSSALGFFNPFRPVETLRPISAQAFGYFASGEAACTINAYGKGKAIYLGFSPNKEFMNALIGWLETEKRIHPLLHTPAGVEVTVRSGEQGTVMFIVNHNFAPVHISLPAAYRDVVQGRVLEGDVCIEPQYTLVLVPADK